RAAGAGRTAHGGPRLGAWASAALAFLIWLRIPFWGVDSWSTAVIWSEGQGKRLEWAPANNPAGSRSMPSVRCRRNVEPLLLAQRLLLAGERTPEGDEGSGDGGGALPILRTGDGDFEQCQVGIVQSLWEPRRERRPPECLHHRLVAHEPRRAGDRDPELVV